MPDCIRSQEILSVHWLGDKTLIKGKKILGFQDAKWCLLQMKIKWDLLDPICSKCYLKSEKQQLIDLGLPLNKSFTNIFSFFPQYWSNSTSKDRGSICYLTSFISAIASLCSGHDNSTLSIASAKAVSIFSLEACIYTLKLYHSQRNSRTVKIKTATSEILWKRKKVCSFLSFRREVNDPEAFLCVSFKPLPQLLAFYGLALHIPPWWYVSCESKVVETELV